VAITYATGAAIGPFVGGEGAVVVVVQVLVVAVVIVVVVDDDDNDDVDADLALVDVVSALVPATFPTTTGLWRS